MGGKLTVSEKKETRVLLVGLDGSGKTCILYKLLGDTVTSVPTIGFNLEHVAYKNVNLAVWDIGGGEHCRQFWTRYYKDAQAIIFVVDSSDHKRIDLAGEELQTLLAVESLAQIPLLIFANKRDLSNCMRMDQIRNALALNEIQDRPWFIKPTCAPLGEGVDEGLAWLVSALKEREKSLSKTKTKTKTLKSKHQKSTLSVSISSSITSSPTTSTPTPSSCFSSSPTSQSTASTFGESEHARGAYSRSCPTLSETDEVDPTPAPSES